MKRAALALASILVATPSARADGLGGDLASPWRPAAENVDAPPATDAHPGEHDEHEGGETPQLDLSATTLVPLAVGGAMHVDLIAGLFLRVQGSVVVPAYVDAINDIGQGYGVWDASTAAAIRDLLVDAVIIEAAAGMRPFDGPLELSVAYFMLWREGMAPAMMGLGQRALSVTVYAVHPELTLRMPLGSWLVMRVSVGWVHAVATDARIGALPEDGEAEEAARVAGQETIATWLSSYGMGPTLSASLGFHFE